MKKETKLWFEQAEEHYSDALFMYENRRYSGALFFCHQALEKVIKAVIVEKVSIIPPKSHALEHLLTISKLEPPNKAWRENLAEITRHFWRVRYSDYRRYTYNTKEKVEPTIISTKEIYQWVKKQLKNT